MRITCDPQADAMSIKFNNLPYHHTEQVTDLILIGLSENQDLISIELLRLSHCADGIQKIAEKYDIRETMHGKRECNCNEEI